MKKIIYMFLTVSLVFSSCKKEDDPVAIISGCMDATATNYNSAATTQSANACTYDILGCTDATAFNYDPLANTDDGTCIPVLLGCIDSTAVNYNPLANTDDGSCEYSIIAVWNATSMLITSNGVEINMFDTSQEPHFVSMVWNINSNGSLSIELIDSFNYQELTTATWSHIGDTFTMVDSDTGEIDNLDVVTLNKNNLVLSGTMDDGDGNLMPVNVSLTR